MAQRAHKTKGSEYSVINTSAGFSSVKVDIRNIPNPYYNKVLQMADSPEYDFVMGTIGDLDLETELERAMLNPDVMENLYKMLDRFQEIPLVPPTMPPAPQSLQLYARTADDAYVADIGSGDTKKASRSQSKISFYDNDVIDQKVKFLDADRDNLPDVDVITSYNTLTQLAHPDRLLDVDSMHIFPDIAYIKNSMGSKVEGGKIVTETNGKVFVDYDRQIPGDKLSEGYLAANGYSRSMLHLGTTTQPVKSRPFSVPVTDTKVELSGEATKKLDGTAMLLKFKNGTASLTTRRGVGIKLSVLDTGVTHCALCLSHYRGPQCMQRRCRNASDPPRGNRSHLPKDFEAYVERVRCGDSFRYVLLRVIIYGRYAPFHGLQALRTFVDRVIVNIDGFPLLAPSDPLLLDVPADGFIFRHDGVDYRWKTNYTVDLSDPREFVETALMAGFVVEPPTQKSKRLAEYALIATTRGHFKLVFHRERYDKEVETDYKNNIEHYLDMASYIELGSEADDSSTTADLSMTLTDTIE